MQSEDFDKRIRDAADNHHPAYEEMAWTKMEVLLAKHLPTEKDDRRRIIFFLLLFLLLGGGAWLVISKPWHGSSVVAGTTNEVKTPVNKSHQDAGSKSLSGNSIPLAGSASPQKPATDAVSPAASADRTVTGNMLKQDVNNNIPPGHLQDNTQHNDVSIMVSPGQKATRKKREDTKTRLDKDKDKDGNITMPSLPINTNESLNTKTTADIPSVSTQKNDRTDKPLTNITTPATAVVSPQPGINKDAAPVITNDKKVATEIAPATTAKMTTAKKGKDNGLALTLSAGPDISSVGYDKAGKIKPVYGLGLNYTLNRFTVRTGFYAARKVYTATPGDYKPNTPISNYNLYKVNANCKVYELPVSVAWDFARAKNHNWFGAASLSSYLMKEESYDYIYKTATGQQYSYNWTFKNENKHFFSVLSLSAGYTRKLGKTFSFSAEPYLKLPLTGIGHGNVKLNSGGILFTVGARLTGKHK